MGQDGVQGGVWFVGGELVGQGIKFYILGSRTTGQNEIEPAEEYCPSSLPRVESPGRLGVDQPLVAQKITLHPESRRVSNGRSSPSMQRLAFSGAGTVQSFGLISTPTATDEPDLLVKPDSLQESDQAYHSTGTSLLESCEDAQLA